MTDNKKPTPQERKEMTAELRKKHQPYFDAEKTPEASFIPKMAHFVPGLEGLHMGFFESEMKEDVYTEMVSMQLESEDPSRTLYKVRYNPHFEEEYAKSAPMSNGSCRYFIPLDEMEAIDPTKSENKKITIPKDPDADLPMDQMTMRDYVAIHTGKPVSFKPWLNELIQK